MPAYPIATAAFVVVSKAVIASAHRAWTRLSGQELLRQVLQDQRVPFLANLNNQIILRLEDTDTAQWFSDKVGETGITNIVQSSSTSTGSEAHLGEFSGSMSRSRQLEKVPMIPVELITKLPNLQYFLRVSGGAAYQGRIPIIEG